MSRSVDETRREFLLKLAKGAAFVPPAIASLDVLPAAAQAAGGKGAPAAQTAAPATAAVTGELSPVASVSSTTSTSTQLQGTEQAVPWDPSSAAAAPPWSRPPPTQTGR